MPDFIARQECPECGEAPEYLGRMHADDCSRPAYVTVRYVRERQPMPVTEEMVERVLRAFTGLETVMRERVRNMMRFALEDALDGANDE